jgi:hypothetical protein
VAADLSGISTDDLIALKAGDLTKVSTEGLKALQGMQPPASKPSNLYAAIPEAIMAMGSGIAGSAASGLAGLGQAMSFPQAPKESAGDTVRKVQEAMTYAPRTQGGQMLTDIASYIPQKYEQGTDWLGQAAQTGATELKLPPEAAGAIGAAVKTALNYPQPLLRGLAAPLGKMLSKSESATAAGNALNAPFRGEMGNFKEAGLKISPAEANPSLFNRFMEGFSGQPKVQQLASFKNQPILDDLARKGLGIPSDTPLTVKALESVRKEAGKAYDAVRNAGRVETGEAYQKALNNIVSKFEGAEKDFPGMAKSDVADAVKAARVDSFDASSGIDAMKIQRGMADKAFRQGDTELGKAHKAIADAIESEIERHLAKEVPAVRPEGTIKQTTPEGRPDTLKAFKNAREIIAKSYDVQKALKGEHVDARVLFKQLQKGHPLSGELKTAAQFAGRFPKSAQSGTGSAPTLGGWGDIGLGALGAGGAHLGLGLGTGGLGAAGIAALLARPVIRSALLSGLKQSTLDIPTAKSSAILRIAEAVARNPDQAILLPAMGQQP